MENGDARPFQYETGITEYDWNVVELESRIYLRSKIHELIATTMHSTLTTSDLRKQLELYRSQFGPRFSIRLVHALQRGDEAEREALVWLLTQLNDPATIPLLHKMRQQKHVSHAVRLSAGLTLAGMGATPEMLAAAQSFYSSRQKHVQKRISRY